VPLRFLATRADPALLRLPWELPLEQWPSELEVPLARGLSRHVVRFVRVEHDVYAVKETRPAWAEREYGMLRNLRRLNLPVVEPVGIVSGRETVDDEPIEPAELFHDVLVHRWYLSEQAGAEVDFFEAAKSYIDGVMPSRAASVTAAETAALSDADATDELSEPEWAMAEPRSDN